jgi:hypothetical protein
VNDELEIRSFAFCAPTAVPVAVALKNAVTKSTSEAGASQRTRGSDKSGRMLIVAASVSRSAGTRKAQTAWQRMAEHLHLDPRSFARLADFSGDEPTTCDV